MQDYQQFPNLLGRILPIPTPTSHLRTYSSSQTQLQPPPPVKCPRCDSTDTKFGYYNNYNLSQPRHFCKSCRRYWTKGGVLRNVPVGGGCRKNNNKRIKSKQAKSPSNLPGSGSSSESSEPAKNNPGSDPVQEVTPSQLFTEAVFNQSGFQFSDPGLVVGEPEPEADGGNNINGLDWGGCDGGLLFDVTGSGDPPVYWNQTSWGDTDPNSLFLP